MASVQRFGLSASIVRATDLFLVQRLRLFNHWNAVNGVFFFDEVTRESRWVETMI